MMSIPKPSKWNRSKVVVRLILVLGILQGFLLGGLVYQVTGESGRTHTAVQRNNEGNCRLFYSFLPRNKEEVPTSPYGKRLVEAVHEGIDFYQCSKFPIKSGGTK